MPGAEPFCTFRRMADARRRVLMLAYFFPPLGGSGVQRTLKFARYLEPLGWDATVVSTRSRAYGVRDPSLLDEIPEGTRVIRARALPVARYAGIALYHLRLMRLRAWVTWPDGGLGWAPFALVAALRATRRDRPDVLFSSSAPFGAHLVALALARLTGIPWVADFRDEWSANPGLRQQPRLLNRLAARAEVAITARTARVVVAADYFRLGGVGPDDPRRVVIVNGVDEADLAQAASAEPSRERFVLAHVGTIYGEQDPTPVLEALGALVQRGEVDPERLEVRLVGPIWVRNLSPPTSLQVTQTGLVDHRRAVLEMCSATALLLYVAPASLAPSGKLFEYLGSGRPILCVARKDNLATQLVEEWGAGVSADPRDAAAVEGALLELWQRWLDDRLDEQKSVRERALEHYSRQANAKRLAEVLEAARNG
jgi:glycosyltransferase involved in cell wall biosynthesis